MAMTLFGPVLLAPAASTGNVTGAAFQMNPNDNGHAFQFVVEVAGATPTVTAKIQGSVDNVNWYDLLYVTDASDTPATTPLTKVAVGASIIYTSNAGVRFYKFYRVVTSANTNVTFRCEAYDIVEG